MTDNTRIWRLPLPDEWEPTDYWCVSFQIPAGTDYVEALSAAIGLLTISKTFERDETHEGAATVAKTWERALYLAPMVVNEDCSPLPIPPIPDAAAAADQAAAVFTMFYRHIVTTLNTCAPTVDDCGPCVDDLFDTLVAYGASEAVRGALADVCRKLNDIPPGDRGIYEEDCPYTDLFDDLSVRINDNPYDWLNKLSDWIFDWLNQTSDEIFNALNVTAGLMTGAGIQGFIQDNGGVPSGGGATFGGDCDWEYEFDFASGSGGWSPYIVNGAACAPPDDTYDAATYGGGSWNAVWHPCDGVNNLAIELSVAFDFFWRGAIITYTLDDYHEASLPGLYTGNSLSKLVGFVPATGSHVIDPDITPATTTVDARIVVGIAPGNLFSDAVDATITNLVIQGRGPNPFA